MGNDRREVIVKCADNCSALSIDKWDGENEYFITTYKSYSGKNWYEKLKDIIRIIKGETVVDTEIILDETDFERIRNFK
jgi:hypothetical protein